MVSDNFPNSYFPFTHFHAVSLYPNDANGKFIVADLKGFYNFPFRLLGFLQRQREGLVPDPIGVFPDGFEEPPGGLVLNLDPIHNVEIGLFAQVLYTVDRLPRQSLGQQVVAPVGIERDGDASLLAYKPTLNAFAGNVEVFWP
jgi:hypothetical protein